MMIGHVVGRVGLAVVVCLSALSSGLLPVAPLQAAETCTDASANDVGADTAPALFRDAFDEAIAYSSAPERLGQALGVPVRIALCPDNPPESLGTIGYADASGKVTRCVVLVYAGGGYAPLVSAPAGRGSMGTVTISANGSTGTALALLDDRKGHPLNTNYVWTCGTIA